LSVVARPHEDVLSDGAANSLCSEAALSPGLTPLGAAPRNCGWSFGLQRSAASLFGQSLH